MTMNEDENIADLERQLLERMIEESTNIARFSGKITAESRYLATRILKIRHRKEHPHAEAELEALEWLERVVHARKIALQQKLGHIYDCDIEDRITGKQPPEWIVDTVNAFLRFLPEVNRKL